MEQIVVDPAKTIAAEAAELEDELMNVFKVKCLNGAVIPVAR